MQIKKDRIIDKKLIGLPRLLQEKLLRLRELIYEVAKENPVIGPLEESLKWGQVSYSPQKVNIGTAIRIDVYPYKKDYYAMFFHCQTSLIQHFKYLFPQLSYEGKRAILLSCHEALPEKIIKQVILHTLTYKLRKRDAEGKGAYTDNSPSLNLGYQPTEK